MRSLRVYLALGMTATVVAGVCAAGAHAARPAPARVQVLSSAQRSVVSAKRIRVRVAARRRGVVRLGGRVIIRVRGRRRIVRLTRRRVIRVKRRSHRTLLLRLTARGLRELRSARTHCGASRVQVFGIFDTRRGGRGRGRTRKRGRGVRFRAQTRSLRRDLLRCFAARVPKDGSGSGYSVGVADRDVSPGPDGRFAGGTVYLGGYGIGSGPILKGRAATGVLGPGVHSRAIAIGARGHALAVADMEMQGWFAATRDGPYGITDMRRAVERRTGGALKASQVIIQSDHTHSGPDAMGVWGGVPLAYRRYIADRTVAAIVAAYRSMRPGTLYYGTAPGRDLLSNQFDYDAQNKAVDSDVRVLQARDGRGRPFATLLNFSAHPTVLGSSNTKASGDWVAAANPLLQSRFLGARPMTMVGTLGRTQPAGRGCADAPLPPAGPKRDLCSIRSYAEQVVERAEDAAVAARPLGGPPAVAARSYLIQDLSTSAPILGLNYAGAALGAQLNRAILPPWTAAALIGTVTGSARIGDVLLSSFPGEAYPQIALAVRSRVPARGWMTAGLADDQLGYLIAPYTAYPEPIRRSFFNQRGDQISPIDNDNYFFNVSHTLGARVQCSALRGAGEVFGRGSVYRDRDAGCLAFLNDANRPAGADAGP